MKAARWIFALLAIACVVPELSRYTAERQLYILQGVLPIAQHDPTVLRRISNDAEHLRTYPGDWRPLNVAGTASLVAGDSDRAIALFSRALQLGERPEILANLGFAYQSRGDKVRASAAFARAVQIAPNIRMHIDRVNARTINAMRLQEQSTSPSSRPGT